MNFGEILNNLMKEENITQAELAKSIGYTQRAVSKWVNCQSEPTEKAIAKCATYFRVSADYLLGLEDDFGTKTHNEATAAPTYSAEERRLVDYFRQLSPNMQRIALNTLQGMSGGGEDSLHKKA